MKRRVYLVAFGFVAIGAGLIAVLSLGSYYPNWELKFAAWHALSDIRKRE